MRQIVANRVILLGILGIATVLALLVDVLSNFSSQTPQTVLLEQEVDYLDNIATKTINALRNKALTTGSDIAATDSNVEDWPDSSIISPSSWDEIGDRIQRRDMGTAERIAKKEADVQARIEKAENDAAVRIFGAAAASKYTKDASVTGGSSYSAGRTSLSRAIKKAKFLMLDADNATEQFSFSVPIKYEKSPPPPPTEATAQFGASSNATGAGWFGDLDIGLGEMNPSMFSGAGRQKPDFVPSGAAMTAEPPTVSECPSLLCKQRKLERLGVNTGERHRQWSDRLSRGDVVEGSYRMGPSPQREVESTLGMYADILDGDQP